MRIEIDFRKKLEQNADRFFELSKKAKKKSAGLHAAIAKLESEIKREQEKQFVAIEKKPVLRRKRDWFEKFRWFFTSDGFLVIGGRDAKSNEQIVKKFLEESDLFFHADVLGAPHCVLKTKNNDAPTLSKQEAASFAVIFSRAWKAQAGFADAYWALPSQVSKKAPSGEAILKGAFMVYGQRHYERKLVLECGIGLEKTDSGWRVVSGPLSAVKKNALFWVKLVPGKTEKGPLSKKLFRFFEQKTGDSFSPLLLDELVQALPPALSDWAGMV